MANYSHVSAHLVTYWFIIGHVRETLMSIVSFLQEAGDLADDNNDDNQEDKEYLEDNDIETKKSPKGKAGDTNLEKNKFGDKVDSVYLRPPPPHKARSTTTTASEEEDCGIKCLYYTLQCCDCVLM